MPRLILRAFERHVESDFHDFVLGAEHRSAHRCDPRMRTELDEPGEGLGMHFDVPASWAAPNCAAGTLDRFPERRHRIAAHASRPLAAEPGAERSDAVTLQRG